MTLNVTQIGDNPQQPGIFAETYIPDQLIAGRFPLVTQPIVLAAGSNLPRGTVLGQQTTSSVTATAASSNVGNGTVGAMSAGAQPEFGTYTLKATSSTVFAVTGPEGEALGNATVGTPFASAKINFEIAAGGTAFAANDSFTLNLVDSVGNFIKSVATATDGSQIPTAILADFADATNGPVRTGAYVAGEFNADALIYDASWTIEALTSALRPYSIFVKYTQGAYTAADPS